MHFHLANSDIGKKGFGRTMAIPTSLLNNHIGCTLC